MREVTASAPGKVNLLLKVGQPTADGYHPLVTVFECLSMREYVTVRTSRTPGIQVETIAYQPNGQIDYELTEELAALAPEDHLAVKAAKAVQPLAALGPWKATSAGLKIRVRKHIPIAGGMAGGSADAAATLLACNELWQLGLSSEQLVSLGRALGADVPACIRGGISLGVGRGDHLISLPEPEKPHHWVMALAYGGLSTPEVFRAYDALYEDTQWPTLPLVDDHSFTAFSHDSHAVAAIVENDLTQAAIVLRPELSQTLQDGEKAGALAAILSGSGPTCAFLARDVDHAQELAERVQALPTVKAVCVTSGPSAPACIEEVKDI